MVFVAPQMRAMQAHNAAHYTFHPAGIRMDNLLEGQDKRPSIQLGASFLHFLFNPSNYIQS